MLLKCQAGCQTKDVLASVGMTWADLHPRHSGGGDTTIVETYDYTDEGGTPLYQVCRLAPKDFRQRRPNGAGGWTWSTKGVRRVLYRLPDLQRQPVVYIVEGEKDVDALRKLGLAATTNASGAASGSRSTPSSSSPPTSGA